MSPDVHATPAQRAARRVGSTLLKWRLDALLGVGGTAAVFAGTHHNRSRVALKILHRELSSIPELRARFLREAYVANSVGHEGAVQVIDDHLSEEGEPVLVMQLLEGQSLDALQTARGVLTPAEALRIADEILDVLAAAHARGIIHRDIKPQNIFITAAGAVKLLDFGVARLFDGTASMTATGVLVGTPAYMPPEQAGGHLQDIGPPSDLWSVGATVFTLLTGRFVHEAENAQQHTVRAAVFPARSIAKLRPDLPAPLVSWVDKALAFEIPRRFQNVGEMRAALARVRATPGLGAPPSPGPAAPVAAAARAPVAAPGWPPQRRPRGRRRSLPVHLSRRPTPRPSRAFTGCRRPRRDGGSRARRRPGSRACSWCSASWRPSSSTGSPRARAGLRPRRPRARDRQGRRRSPRGWARRRDRPRVARTHRAPRLRRSLRLRPRPPERRESASRRRPARCSRPRRTRCASARRSLGPKGRMSVDVTFHPDGETTAQVEIRFARTPTGVCVEDVYRSKRVSAFEGPAVTVTRMISLQ